MSDDFKCGLALGFLGTCLLFALCAIYGCADEQAERKHWQDCGGVYHEECLDAPNFRECEYEFYKECINAEPTS
jgi:hypothetical protein